MSTVRITVILSFFLLLAYASYGQAKLDSSKVIQFSGMVVSQNDFNEPEALPYTNISVLNTSRGTVSDVNGFFSLVALTTDTIVFSRIGFKTVRIGLPDSLDQNRYSWYQIMSQDSFILPEAVIYPWPSREHFKYDLLAIDISNELREQANKNIAKEVLDEVRYTVPADGGETYRLVQQAQIQQYQYAGQLKPQNILNPLAWKKFIDAWRRGDFKKKKKK